MKTTLFAIILAILSTLCFAQGKLLSVDDHFPDIDIKHLINAPVTEFSLSGTKDKKIYILNFWGTWCAPCIPEMDNLAKLQNANAAKIQVIGITDDSPERLKTYLQQKPTKVWLASDTAALFYTLFNVNSVSQSAIINSDRKIIAMVKTDSINQAMIDKLVKGEFVKSNAVLKEKKINTDNDIFGVDSTLMESFTIRSYVQGQRSSSRSYNKGIYERRRITYLNTSLESLFINAYQLPSTKLIFFEFDKKLVSDYENKQSLYCLDLMVKPAERDSLYAIFRHKLSGITTIRARSEFRKVPVYVITRAKDKSFNAPVSKVKEMSYGFSGRGFDGEGITVTQFANLYLNNELETPVVDETALTGTYDIKTIMDMRNAEGIRKSIIDLGLEITKTEREMKVLVLYK